MSDIKKIQEITSDESENESDGETLNSEDFSQEDGIPQLINHFFTNDDGENIANILTDLKKSLDTHNKLVYKLLSLNSKKKESSNDNEGAN